MRTADIQVLFDFTYWADRQILQAAAGIPVADFTRPVSITYRNLQSTLVHTLDVEMSWRRRLRGEPKVIWDLGDADRFPLWYYLVHIVTHSEQQRRDAQLILRHLGHEPPDLEFLYYADSLGASHR